MRENSSQQLMNNRIQKPQNKSKLVNNRTRAKYRNECSLTWIKTTKKYKFTIKTKHLSQAQSNWQVRETRVNMKKVRERKAKT